MLPLRLPVYLNFVLLSLDSRQGPIDIRILRSVYAFSRSVRPQVEALRLRTLPQMICRLCSPPFFTYSVFHRSAVSHDVCHDPVCIFTVDNHFFKVLFISFTIDKIFLCSFNTLVFPSEYLVFVIKCVVFECETWVKKGRK